MKNKRSRTHTWEDTRVIAEAAKIMSGVDYLHAMVERKIPAPPICSLIPRTRRRLHNP